MKCKTRCVYTKLDFSDWTIECKDCGHKVPLSNANWWQYGGSIYIDGKLKKKANKKWFNVTIGSPDYVSDIAAYQGKSVKNNKPICDALPRGKQKLIPNPDMGLWQEGIRDVPDQWLTLKQLKKKSKQNNLIK